MGLVTWIGAGVVAFVAARLIRGGWRKPLLLELAIALLTGTAAGLGATLLDFGGWSELDWRAAAFASAVAFAAIGVGRMLKSASRA